MNANTKEVKNAELEIFGYIVRAEGWKQDAFFKTLEAAIKDYEETVIESADFEEEESYNEFEDDLDEDDLDAFGSDDSFEDYGFEENWN